ncbi:hypothetical protein [Bradyrhizobium sp. McL0616]|uniref:hypothetical protein n=1 Tax=Bradyrhizobium sp. McL0616 TaxID=3415674 RepID=UPI003CE6F102
MLLWFPMLNLMIDAMQVVEMRLRLVAAGKATSKELFLLVDEKSDALTDAGAILIRGGNYEEVIDNYRKIVSANFERLSR